MTIIDSEMPDSGELFLSELKSDLEGLVKRLSNRNVTDLAESARAQFDLIRKRFNEIGQYLRGNSSAQRAELQSLLLQSRSLYARWYAIWEAEAVHYELSSGDHRFLSSNSSLGDREWIETGINPTSSVCYVGSGSYPWTALRYAEQAGCRVTCLDRDADSLALSGHLFEARGTANISLVCDSADRHDYSGYTHVTIAAMAEPKAAVVDCVLQSASAGSTVLVRSAMSDTCPYYTQWLPPTAETAGSGNGWHCIPGSGLGELQTFWRII